jgi:hypothetical protein
VIDEINSFSINENIILVKKLMKKAMVGLKYLNH